MGRYDSRVCSVARTMEVLGERWTMLIVRDLFNGVRRFDALHRHIGVARDVLTRRLEVLMDAGLVERTSYREVGARERYEYRLTPAGRDLRPILVAIMDWGDEHLAGADGPPLELTHDACGAGVHTQLVCDEGHAIETTTRLHAATKPGARLLVTSHKD
ncbi:helix-turn-helix domain-containing protein [soil metagenome]